jgi:hypothetical protein
MKITLSLILMIAPLVCAAAGEEAREPLVYYEFSSGGAYHPSGYGEWIVRFSNDGAISVRHKRGGEVTDMGQYRLADGERAELDALFLSLDISGMTSSTRPGLPDEALYSFTLRGGSGTHTASVWINDARDNQAIMGMVSYLATLIERYTGEKPVMR